MNRIINVDETPIYLEFFTDKTYNKKGAKEVIIKTNGNEKKHVTVILAVSASGKKLPSVLIFKGKSNKNNEKRYNRLNVVKNKRILIFFQENGWINDSIFKKRFDNIYLEHENKVKKKCLFLLDKAPSHLTKNIISYLEINQTEYTLIPGKITKFLQSLDIGINMPFKSQLKNKFLISEANKLRLNLIEWILCIWEDDTLIKPSIITASFKKTTITYPLDGSMDIDFEMPEEIVNQYNKE